MCNMMFDVKAPRAVYDKLNSVVRQQNLMFYGGATALHMMTLGYLSFFFRYRRLSKASVLVAGTAYYCAFETINNILYKVIVDREVINTTRKLGYAEQVQPTGTYLPRDITFK